MSTNLCTVRADLREAGIKPVGETTGKVLDVHKTYQYKWEGDATDGVGIFMLLVDGVWEEYISVDFDFPFDNDNDNQ